MAATVETVRGPVEVASLGAALMHEHIFVLDPQALQNYAHFWGESYWDEEAGVAEAVAKLQAVRDARIQTLVDPTAIGLGRYVPRIQRVNADVDLNILVATGLYAFLELPQFFRYRSVDQLAEFFVRDLRQGIDDTGVRAAFLKCAVEEYGLAGDVPGILAATAVAAVETGAPIMVHTNAPARTGLLAIEALAREGVDLMRVVIAHAGDSNDLDYLRELAGHGVALGCDRWGIEKFNPFERRVETLAALVAEGFVEQIHLSHDAACFFDFFTGDEKFAGERPDYLLLAKRGIPALLDAGVTQEQIDTMMVDNPRRFFGS